MGNIWKIVFATVVIFAAGALTGGLLVHHTQGGKNARGQRTQAQRQASWQPAPGEMLQRGTNEIRPMLEQQRVDFVLRVQRELRLDPEQRERIERIVRDGQEHTKEFWDKNQPELRRMVQETREKIRAELTPEQRTRFEEIQKQQRPGRSGESPGVTGRSSGEVRRPSVPGSNQPARPLRQTPTTRPGSAPPPTPER